MTKSEFLEILAKELERLEEVEHVSDLANNGRYEEVDAVVAEIDYSALKAYKSSCDACLDISEIPGKRYLAFVIYLFGSEYDEVDLMGYRWQDLQEAVGECGEAGVAIYNTMVCDRVNTFETFRQLIKGRKIEIKHDIF